MTNILVKVKELPIGHQCRIYRKRKRTKMCRQGIKINTGLIKMAPILNHIYGVNANRKLRKNANRNTDIIFASN